MNEHAANRRDNFFKGTMRDPDARTAPDAAIDDALIVVGASIDAQAQADGRELSTVQRQRALSVAQRLLRALPRDQLQNISAHSGLLKTITDQSLVVAPVTDPRAVAQARLDERGQGVGGADPAAALLGRRGFDGSGVSSFTRLAELGGTSTEMARAIAQATSEAMRLGMPWALNNPELLKLGPAAIKTLHEAGVQRERFERMTGDKVGFRAATAVDIAGFAKRHNLTPEQTNRLYDKISDGVEIISGGNRGIQRELDEATRRYVTGADTPESRRALEDAYQRHADTPEKKAAAAVTTQALIAPMQQDRAAVATRNADAVARDADAVARDADAVANQRTEQRTAADRQAALDGLDGPAPASPVNRAEAPTVEQPQPSKVAVAPPVVQTAATADDKKPVAKAPAAPKV